MMKLQNKCLAFYLFAAAIVLPAVTQSETEIELGSLLRQDFQGLHNELLLRLGEHYQQVSAQTLAHVVP